MVTISWIETQEGDTNDNKPVKWKSKQLLSFASSICPDKIFFVQNNIQIVKDKNIVQG